VGQALPRYAGYLVEGFESVSRAGWATFGAYKNPASPAVGSESASDSALDGSRKRVEIGLGECD
jgi:hypothetical protein